MDDYHIILTLFISLLSVICMSPSCVKLDWRHYLCALFSGHVYLRPLLLLWRTNFTIYNNYINMVVFIFVILQKEEYNNPAHTAVSTRARMHRWVHTFYFNPHMVLSDRPFVLVAGAMIRKSVFFPTVLLWILSLLRNGELVIKWELWKIAWEKLIGVGVGVEWRHWCCYGPSVIP